MDEPAPTITGGHDTGDRKWIVATGANSMVTGRTADDLQPYERATTDPATTIACDPRVQPPGHKQNADDPLGKFDGRAGENAVRVSVQEAAVLQSFPPDYPWQGNQGKQFEQVGNAVPPLLAAAVLQAVIGPSGTQGCNT